MSHEFYSFQDAKFYAQVVSFLTNTEVVLSRAACESRSAKNIDTWVVDSNLNLHDALISLKVDKLRPIGAPEWWSYAKAELSRLEKVETERERESEQYAADHKNHYDDRTATTGLSPPDWDRM